MSKSDQPVLATHDEIKLRFGSYVKGFVLSIALTVSAYLLVVNHGASRAILIGIVSILAIIQFTVQVFYFLHLGQEAKPRFKLYVFLFMLAIVIIIVFGSIWIISNLNTRMTIPQQIQYLNNQDEL